MKTCYINECKNAYYAKGMCRDHYRLEYRKKNADSIKKNRAKRYQDNIEKEKSYQKRYCKENPEKVRDTLKRYRDTHKDKIIKWGKDHPEISRNRQRKWCEKHPEKRRAIVDKFKKNHPQYMCKYIGQRLSRDIPFKLALRLRSRQRQALRRHLSGKPVSAIRNLGCTVQELVKHIESRFVEGMTWNNWGNKEGHWSMDHIFPLSKVDWNDRESILKTCHYTNLRPMWHIDNIKKGNKIEGTP